MSKMFRSQERDNKFVPLYIAKFIYDINGNW